MVYKIKSLVNNNEASLFKIDINKSWSSRGGYAIVWMGKSDFENLSVDIFDQVEILVDDYVVFRGFVIDYQYSAGMYKVKIMNQGAMLSKKVIYKKYDNWQIANSDLTQDSIVKDIYDQVASYAGLTGADIDDIIDENGNHITISFDARGFVSDVLDRIAEVAGAYWYVQDGVFKFKKSPIVDKSSSITIDNNVASFDDWQRDLSKFANKIIVYGSKISNFTESFQTDGSQSSFTLSNLVYKDEVLVYLNGKLVDSELYTVQKDYDNWKTNVVFSQPPPANEFADVATAYPEYSYVRKVMVYVPKDSSVGGGATITDPVVIVKLGAGFDWENVYGSEDDGYKDIRFVKMDGSAEYPSIYLGRDASNNRYFAVKLSGETFDAEAGDVVFYMAMIYGNKDAPNRTNTIADVMKVFDDYTASISSDKWECVASLGTGEMGSGFSGSITAGQDEATLSWSVSIDTTRRQMKASGTLEISSVASEVTKETGFVYVYTNGLDNGLYKWLIYYDNSNNLLIYALDRNSEYRIVQMVLNADGAGSSDSDVWIYNRGVYWTERWADANGSTTEKVVVGERYPLMVNNLVVVYSYVPRVVMEDYSKISKEVSRQIFVDTSDIEQLQAIASSELEKYNKIIMYGKARTSLRYVLGKGIEILDKVTVKDVRHSINEPMIITGMKIRNNMVELEFMNDISQILSLADWGVGLEKSIREREL